MNMSLKLNRRSFLKGTAAGIAASAFAGLGISLEPARARAAGLAISKGKITTSVCCFCAVGCASWSGQIRKRNAASILKATPIIPSAAAPCAPRDLPSGS